MSSLDLDPENYTLNEISDFFNLNPNHNITQVNDAFRNKHNEVTLNKTLTKPEKDKMCSFFEQLKNKLVLNLTQKPHEEAKFNNYSDVMSNSFNNRIDTIIPKNKVLKNNASVLINPENAHQKVTNKLLSIDTIFRENYLTTKSTNFKLNVPSTIKNVKSINLVSLEVPLTYYNVSELLGNNYLHIDLDKIVIPDGKYTNDQLIEELNLQFKLKYPENTPFATYSSITNKTSISLVDKPELNFIKDKGGNEFTWNINGENAEKNIHFVDDSKGAAKISNKKTADPMNKKLGWLLGYRGKKYANNISHYSGSVLPDESQITNFAIINDINSNLNEIKLSWGPPSTWSPAVIDQQYTIAKGQYVNENQGIEYANPVFIIGVPATATAEKIYDGLNYNETYYFKIQPLVSGENEKVAKAFETSYYVAPKGPSPTIPIVNEKVTRFRAYSEIDSTTGNPTVKLSWEFVTDTVFNGFIIEKSENNHTWNTETTISNNIDDSYDITSGLDQGVEYFFRISRTIGGITANDKCTPFPDNTFTGTASEKGNVCATIVGNYDVSIPYELSFENLNTTSIKLKWTKPFLNSHLVTGYKISQSDDGFHYNVIEDDTDSTDTTYTITNLTEFKNYSFRVNTVSKITCNTNLSIPVVIHTNTYNNYAITEGPLDTNVSFKYFYFILDDFNHNQDTNIIALKNNSIQSTKILARISNNLMSGKILMEGTDNTGNDCLTHKRVYYGPVDVNKLHIRITDEFGRDLDLNHSDISMGINFECIYD